MTKIERLGNRRTRKALLYGSMARIAYYWQQWRERRDLWGSPAIWEAASRP